MLSANQSTELFKLKYPKNYLSYEVLFSYVVRQPWTLNFNHVVFIGYGLVLKLYAKMLLTNQIAGFFKTEYLLSIWRYIPN